MCVYAVHVGFVWIDLFTRDLTYINNGRRGSSSSSNNVFSRKQVFYIRIYLAGMRVLFCCFSFIKNAAAAAASIQTIYSARVVHTRLKEQIHNFILNMTQFVSKKFRITTNMLCANQLRIDFMYAWSWSLNPIRFDSCKPENERFYWSRNWRHWVHLSISTRLLPFCYIDVRIKCSKFMLEPSSLNVKSLKCENAIHR